MRIGVQIGHGWHKTNRFDLRQTIDLAKLAVATQIPHTRRDAIHRERFELRGVKMAFVAAYIRMRMTDGVGAAYAVLRRQNPLQCGFLVSEFG